MQANSFWNRMRPFNRRMIRNYLRGLGPQRLILLLTTTGRKTGLPHITPLQYETIDNLIYVASARGVQADWVRNILVDRKVQVQIGKRKFSVEAVPILDPEGIADFLALRLARHPVMIRLIMCLFEGLPWRFSRKDLIEFASQKALFVLPDGGENGQTRFEENP